MMKSIEILHPANFPTDWKITKHKHKYPGYKISLQRALSLLRKNIAFLKLENCKLYTNAIIDENDMIIEYNNKGPGASLFFSKIGVDYYLASDRFHTIKENIFCIAKALDGYILIQKNCKAKEYELITQNQ